MHVRKDMSYLTINAANAHPDVINVKWLKPQEVNTGPNVLVPVKEAVINVVMEIPAPDVDQDTFSKKESAMLAMVAVNATSFKLLPALTELNVFLLLILITL
jgi:hypothetical protein